MVSFNYQNHEIVSSPTVIVSGRCNARSGVVQFINNDNRVFPPQLAEINNGQFKALVHVSPGQNAFTVEVSDNSSIGPYGFADANGPRRVSESASLVLVYEHLPNKPVHLCVVLGHDSNGAYDIPSYRLQRGERADLDTAIRKLKVAGRLMQAFTQDEFRRLGFSNRSFQFVEEEVTHQGIFGYNVTSPEAHREVKVHVIRSPKSVRELRDPNLAQQNPKASDNGGLFSHAIDLIKQQPFFDSYKNQKTAIQCAVLYLDSHWDGNFILTHAALGGGTGDVKLGIFGSHGLHSWPALFAQVTPSFLDATHLSTKEVANDCNQCGTSWECLNITLGAFLHEIGHSFGSPHQVNGVMLRDYMWLNRSFMTREVECLRTKSRGLIIGQSGWDKECHWHELDLLRYLHHDSFSLPIDTHEKKYSTTWQPKGDVAPMSYITNGGVQVTSQAGIFLMEFITKDLARYHVAWTPKAYGGPGAQHELLLDYHQCYADFRARSGLQDDDFDVRILSVGGDLNIKNLKKYVSPQNVVTGDLLGRGTITAYKSALLGREKGNEQVIGVDFTTVSKVRVYHGGALDGIKFYFGTSAPPVPPRNYLKRIIALEPATTSRELTIGNEKPHYTEFELSPGETITKLHFRNGAWIDAVLFETSAGRKSPMYGNANGGHLSTLEAPKGYSIVGLYGYTGRWLDGVGILYAN